MVATASAMTQALWEPMEGERTVDLTLMKSRRVPLFVWRVYGGDAGPGGRSWGFEDPRMYPKGYAFRYGIPPYDESLPRGLRGNTGEWYVKGIWSGTGGEVVPAKGIQARETTQSC